MHNSHAVTAKELAHEADQDGNGELKDALLAVAADRNRNVDTRSLGAWLSRHVGRFEGGLRIVRAGTRQRAVKWKLEKSNV